MGRKLNLTSLLFGETTPKSSSSSSSSPSPSSSSWAWPSCKHPRTDSFRRAADHRDVNDVYKSVNSVYFDSTDSLFTQSSSECYSESLPSAASEDDDSETVIRGLMTSDRLLFEPGGDTSSILEEAKAAASSGSSSSSRGEYGLVPFKESVVMAMESEDPYNDFRKSMEEMVAANRGRRRDWEWLEELLVWYLRVNGRKNHGFIVGAFVDLLVGLAHDEKNDDGTV